RFEKGLPPQLPPVAAARAVKLMSDLCGGTAAKGLVDAFPGKSDDVHVPLTMKRLTQVIGIEVPASQVESILKSLGFEIKASADNFDVRVPFWRTDVTIADDVI